MPIDFGNPLIATKLYIPPARLGWVDRARLIERMKASVNHPLTLICAPAGYGKTTLLSEWIPQNEHCVTWLSLDEGDNDPARFWRYFLAAVQTLNPELCQDAQQLLESPDGPQIEVMLMLAINELAALDYRFSHVFDDYHLIDNPAIDESLTYLIEHLPSNVNLVIATRRDPALPLARWRARGQLEEIRSADLRFTKGEVTAFFNQSMKLDLSAPEIAALETRTEGWVAGLQLVALSIKDQDDRSRFIAAFTGSHRFIVDYLVEEVLSRQPEAVRQFLLSTSILKRLNGSLCNALTGRSDSKAILDGLEQANLFVVPLDDHRGWYRYHHLFAEVLLARLRKQEPERVTSLHQLASEWYEANNAYDQSIHHALGGGDIRRAAGLIEGERWAMLGRGEVNTLLSWLDQLPVEVVDGNPSLSLAYAWIFTILRRMDSIEPRLQAAEAALEANASKNSTGSTTIEDTLRGEIATLRAEIAIDQSNYVRAIALCRNALSLLPVENSQLRGFASYFLGHGERQLGHITKARQAYLEASAFGLQADNLLIALHALSNLSNVQIVMGQLREAAKTCQRITQITSERGREAWPVAGLAYYGLSRLYYEWNDLEAALRYSNSGVEAGHRGGLTGFEFYSHKMLAYTLQAQGDPDGAERELRKIAALSEQEHRPVHTTIAGAWEARLRLRQGRLDLAVRWAERCGLHEDDAVLPYALEVEYLALARVLIAQGRSKAVLELLARLLQAAESDGRTGSQIEILMVQALARQVHGDHAGAMQALGSALLLAEPESYVRMFVDENEPMRTLLEAFCKEIAGGAATDSRILAYAERLLSVLAPPKTESTATYTGVHPSTASQVVEPLSERELEVLSLISAGLTNQEIAAQLVIALSTVKSHINSLYGKLGTHRRAQAVVIARELDLLSD